MDYLAYWKWETYRKDKAFPHGWHFNSDQPQLANAKKGDRVWLVSGRRTDSGSVYVLLSRLVVERVESAYPKKNDYGKYYRVWADPEQSADFDPEGQDMSSTIKRLEFDPFRRIVDEAKIGQALQRIRYLSRNDARTLDAYSAGLRVLHLTGLRSRSA